MSAIDEGTAAVAATKGLMLFVRAARPLDADERLLTRVLVAIARRNRYDKPFRLRRDRFERLAIEIEARCFRDERPMYEGYLDGDAAFVLRNIPVICRR